MKRNIKTIAALITAALMLFSFTACKSSGSNGGNDINEVPATPIITDEPTKAPTAEPTKEAVKEPTAAPEPTKPEVTEEPTPTQEPVATAEPIPETPDIPSNIEVYIGERYESDWNQEQNKSNGWYEYDYPELTEKFAEAYPKLAEAFETYRQDKEDGTESILTDIVSAAVSDEVYASYFRNEELKVIRADSTIVSLHYDYTVYTGGIHGLYGSFGLCWDPVTGESIKLNDIIRDKDLFVDAIYDKLTTDHDIEDFFDYENLKAHISEVLDSELLPFEIGYNYLSVIFNPYDIASHNLGQIYVDFPFKGNETLFNEKYLVSPKNYMVSMDNDHRLKTDLNDNGTVDKIDFYLDFCNEWEDYDGVTFYLNDQPIPKTFEFGEACYGIDPVYIHANDGDYIYFTLWFASEDTMTFAYRIDMNKDGYDENAEDNPWGTIVEIADGGLWDLDRNASYDPMNMIMSCRRDMIGTNFIEAAFYVGNDGLPVQKDEEYKFSAEYELTTKKEFTFKEISWENGEITGETVIPAGEVIRMAYTDAYTYVDCVWDHDNVDHRVRIDMEEERIYFDDDNYYSAISVVGVDDVNELFDGMIYAD
ncbi:MAG: hypothetical protein K6E85_00440 [Lachnospiraceae bacterium]|nr:hypothetical protein [Lachnospiraceae bacterium]